jgi:RHS repeat-associated protein
MLITAIKRACLFFTRQRDRFARTRSVALFLIVALFTQSLMVTPLSAKEKNRGVRSTSSETSNNRPAPQPQAQTIIVYGPRQVDRTGPVSRLTEQFTLPSNAIAPFTVQVVNGSADGSGRVSMATVRLNGVVLVDSGQMNLGVPSLTLPAQMIQANTIEISFFGRLGSHLTVTIAGQQGTPGTAPVINDFNAKQGPPGTVVTLSGTALKANNNDPLVTFLGSNGTRQTAQVISSTATEVRATVPNGALTGLIELSTSGGLAHTATVFTVLASQDFQLTASPVTVSALQRGTAVQIVTVTSQQANFSQLARLSATGLPGGVTVSFDPQQITAGATSTLSIRLANVNLSPGGLPFVINATATIDGHDVQHTLSSTLNVIAAGQTALTGQVLSSAKEPIFGATVSLDGRTAMTDSAGVFLLLGVTAGQDRPVMIDGRTASAPNKTYPVIVEPASIVAGQVNTVPFTFYLPTIDTQFERDVIPNQATVVDNPRMPDLAMTIPAGANLRNRDGSPVTRASITPVAIDRTPAPLPANLATSMVYTSQPGGAISNMPIPVVYPNLGGAAPNTRVELYYFNHDQVAWQRYGFGRVSADGRTVGPEINPATGQPYGLPDFSWHFFLTLFGNNPSDPNSNCGSKGRNPVDLSSGLKLQNDTDISFGGARGILELTRIYTSALANKCNGNCAFGRVTTFNYDIKLSGDFAVNGAGYLVMPDQVDGRLFRYNGTRSGLVGLPVFTNSLTVGQLGDEIRKLANGTFEYRHRNGEVLRFDSNKRLTSMTDTNSNTVTLNYSGNNLSSVTDPVGRSITFAYNGFGHVSSATDPLGRVWHYAYDPSGALLTSVTDPLNNTTSYTYSIGSLLASITDGRGSVVKQITYDSAGRVIAQQFSDGGVEHYAYTLSGTMVSSVTITDSLGRSETRRFNAAGYVIDTTDALGQSAHTERDMTTNLPLSVTGPCGCTEGSYEYDERGNLTKATDRIGGVKRMEYEPIFNRMTKMTDELGRVTNYAYDSHGNMILMTDALGRTTSYTYDGVGELTSVTDPLSHAKQLVYDAQGNITSVKDALNNTTTLEYDAIGRMTAVVDPLARRSAFAYDLLDRITLLTDPVGATTTLDYDANGNLTGFINALSRRWTNAYDTKNRLISRTDPIGRRSRWRYDTDDELTAMISASGRTTGYAYDLRGQVTAITSPLSFVARYAYDNTRNLTSLTDERGNVTTFTYDELYRPTEQRDPLGQVTRYGYDAASNVTSRFDRLGRNTSYTYDALNRPSQIQYVDAVLNYQYDSAYRLTRIDDTQSGSIVWNYDDANRLFSETTPQGLVSYTYNAASQRASMTAADRPPVNYAYDSAGRLATIAQASETFTYGYDTLSRVASLQRPNGVRTNYAYDNVYRLARLTHTNSANQALEDFQYSYSVDNEISSITSLASAQLLPTAKTDTPANAANRVAAFGTTNYTHDNEGQTTTRTDAQGATNFTWDARGRLTRATLSNGQNIDYGYDSLGRRAGRAASGGTTNFLYDGLDVVLDKSNDSTTVDYLNGPGIDNKLRQSSAATGNLYFHQDHLGSTAALTSVSGNVVEQMQYEAFGDSATDSLTRYGYTGRERDGVTKLMYYRARWYDTQQGRFLTEDPIGLKGGLNTYSYGLNRPLSSIDPKGLSWTVAGGTATISPPGGATVQFPAPKDWPDDSDSMWHHFYHQEFDLGCADPESVMEGIIKSPTPGSAAQQPATAVGTPNDATPDGLSWFGPSPVISYVINGMVINVTQPEHPFSPGYVQLFVADGKVHVLGEGTGKFQGVLQRLQEWRPYNPYPDPDLGVWKPHIESIIKNSTQRCGCKK